MMAAWLAVVLGAVAVAGNHEPFPATALPGSVFKGAKDEIAARQLADTVDLKSISSVDLVFLIREKRWLSAALRVLQRAQETPLDFSAPTRSAVTAVRKELDDLIRSLDKKYGEASLISPAFQWAQNSSHIFLQIKFAQRWNAPGALEVENASVVVSDCCFSFKGVGEHSMIRKEYKLFLQFLDKVSEEKSSWHFAAAGRLVATIAKARPRKWERLVRSENVQPENMGVWQDMQAKWKSELASLGAGKKKAKGSDDDDEDEEENEEELAREKCAPGSFVGSKVVEFCPEVFLTKKDDWTILFYSADSSSKQGQTYSKMWRVLADMVPNHNKRAKVGAINCARHSTFCAGKGAKAKELPVIRRYKAGSEEGVTFTSSAGEPILEDLVAWAAGVNSEL